MKEKGQCKALLSVFSCEDRGLAHLIFLDIGLHIQTGRCDPCNEAL